MKLKTKQPNHKGFTLIEMIGVLAVIAILAAVLIPKVFEAINNSRINNAAMSADTVKTAIADHYAKFGGLNIDGSGAAPATITTFPTQYDPILLKEQFLDKPFVTKIGDGVNGMANTHVEIQTCPALGASVTVATLANGGYNLSGVGGTNECSGSYVVQAVITGCTPADMLSLSQRVDGNNLSETSVSTADLRGRVKYDSAGTTCYIYLTHR